MDKGDSKLIEYLTSKDCVFISASNKTNIALLKEKILTSVQIKQVKTGDVLVTNLRHYQNLMQTNEALDRVLHSMANNITGDFFSDGHPPVAAVPWRDNGNDYHERPA